MKIYLPFLRLFFILVTLLPFQAGYSANLGDFMPDLSVTLPWSTNGQVRYFEGDRLFHYINGGAQVYFEYGFVRAAVQEYMNGSQSMVVEIYEMETSTGAFGIYSLNRDDSKPAIEVGDDGTLYDYSVSFWQDRYYVNVMAYTADQFGRSDLQKIAQSISQKIGSHGQIPELVHSLPGQFLNPRSVCYIMGRLGLNSYYYVSAENVFNLETRGVHGVWGTFSQNDSQCSVFLAHYPSAAEANSVHSRLEAVLVEKFRSVSRTGTYTSAVDTQGRHYLCGSDRNRVALIVKSTNAAFAVEILNQIFTQ